MTRSRGRIAVIALVALVALVTIGPLVWSVDPNVLDLGHSSAPPSLTHPLGTDESGRDVLSRLLVGGRISLAVGFLGMSVAVVLGTLVGGSAGYRGGWVDAVLMRTTDSAMAAPTLLIVICTITLFGSSLPVLVLTIGTTSWMGAARVVRGELAVLRTYAFVEAARALGNTGWRIFSRHLLPHLAPVLLVNAAIAVGTSILTESALSFVGLGVQPPTASWGNMLSGAQNSLFTNPMLAIYPGLMIFAAVATANVLGEALRRPLPR